MFPLTTNTAVGHSTDIGAIAQSPILRIFALGVFAVIFVQSFIYVRAAKAAGPSVGMEHRELNQAFRSGAIASIGPSLAVVIVAIALLALFGTPAVLVRIGLIGSAATETASAGIASTTMGAVLGGEGYNQQVFAVAFAAMSISGGAWMLATLILTPLLKRGGHKLSQVNPAAMALIPGAALLGAFSMLTLSELPKSTVHVITVVVSALVMAGLLFIARKLNAHWLKEWALGVSILVALAVAFVAHTA
ncbi:DUF5058 family protein [Arthrobacter crystallopoietes]|uniref:DUF5058 family protein n=1 Tax=Crystallibacter crystallopoietes TaxID=37928 RepID=UPI003D2037F7